MDKIFNEVGIYYAPYPELSDIIVSDLLKESVIKRSVLLSRYTKKYGHHRVVKTLTNLQTLGIIYRFENGCFTILGANENVIALRAFNLTQTQMRILAFIRKHGSIYYAPFFLQTRVNRTLFNRCTKFLMSVGLLDMHKEQTERGGSYRHVYTFQAKPAPMSKSGALLSH